MKKEKEKERRIPNRRERQARVHERLDAVSDLEDRGFTVISFINLSRL